MLAREHERPALAPGSWIYEIYTFDTCLSFSFAVDLPNLDRPCNDPRRRDVQPSRDDLQAPDCFFR